MFFNKTARNSPLPSLFCAATVLAVLLFSACPSENADDGEAPAYPIPSGMELVWSDEFDYEGAPNPEKWSYSLGLNGWGNDEIQCYTDSRANSWVKDGKLFIAAVNDGGNWTSARLKTAEAASWTCGYFEIRAKLAEGRGITSSLWMLPRDDLYGRWPASGEIVIAEREGSSADAIYQAVYTENSGESGMRKAAVLQEEGSANGFHTYAVEWTADFMRWLVDGEETFRLENSGEGAESWPFDIPFHLILSVAVGGSRGGQDGVDGRIKSAVMEVDYVRVYHRTKEEN